VAVVTPPYVPKRRVILTPSEQITKLATFIMEECPGEPRQSEGAVDCAIRIIRKLHKEKQ
jgi:hypothetical protein